MILVLILDPECHGLLLQGRRGKGIQNLKIRLLKLRDGLKSPLSPRELF
jgi:hypothetical protein